MNDNRYISYNHQTGQFLACHPDLTVLTNYLFIEQSDYYSIVPISNPKLFEELSTVVLFKLYLSLGGDKTIFESAREIMAQRLRLLDLCRKLAVNLQETEINGFECSIQATYINNLDCKIGYKYQLGSNKPSKVN
jgi:hypothetical protein